MHLSQLESALRQLKDQNRLRTPDDRLEAIALREEFGPDFVDAATNDYLGLAAGPVPDSVSRETMDGAPSSDRTDVSRETTAPLGARASRLVFGTHPAHLELERTVAQWLGYPESLLFASGYAANVGALPALISRGDVVISDELNHASLIDGIRLSRGFCQVVPHLELSVWEQRLKEAASAPARWVVCESYYSMDGDGPDLAALSWLCSRHDAHLYVDEAHSVGTFGPGGRGLCTSAGVQPDVIMAGLGKAVGAQGACVVTRSPIREWLWNKARSHVFSTAPSPILTRQILAQVERVQVADSARERLQYLAQRARAHLQQGGIPSIPGSFGPVLSVVVGDELRALELAASLRQQGILAQAIRPPTVAPGKSRVRLVLRAAMSDSAVDRVTAMVIRESCRA